jgi:hypothetical protein
MLAGSESRIDNILMLLGSEKDKLYPYEGRFRDRKTIYSCLVVLGSETDRLSLMLVGPDTDDRRTKALC